MEVNREKHEAHTSQESTRYTPSQVLANHNTPFVHVLGSIAISLCSSSSGGVWWRSSGAAAAAAGVVGVTAVLDRRLVVPRAQECCNKGHPEVEIRRRSRMGEEQEEQ
ncbi:hypothetical protein E2C01_026209 [Portunus trituberculatus]|uniref:Uncharacterized protein n=1 Tax=Portunus trituberculatus TaxID=210409 RepID=A0A5B7EI69_PORTR|nr:hypothetical protein [Portunus trituberculatus]